MNLLFICKNNNWRSRTAETVFGKLPLHEARSAGIGERSRVPITSELISWADMLFVMEENDLKLLKEKFKGIPSINKSIVLDIPDRYQYMDEELILMLKTILVPYLDTPLKR